MTAHNAPPDGPSQHGTGATATSNTDNAENGVAGLKREEIVLALQPNATTDEYLIYSLSESSTSDDGKPFELRVKQVRKQQLPEHLSLEDLLLDRDALPPTHLRSPRQAHVVVSTHSGLRLAPRFYDDVLRPLLAAVGLKELSGTEDADAHGYRVTRTKDAHTVKEVAHELARDTHAGVKTVVLLSGDGGVVDLLNGLDQSSPDSTPSPTDNLPTIALLPLGTGNALFHSLHKPQYSSTAPAPSALVLALRTLLLTGTAAPLPTFRASFSPGARLVSVPSDHHADEDGGSTTEVTTKGEEEEKHVPVPVSHLVGAIVASYGFHASLVWESDTPAYRVHGAKRFGMAAAELLKIAHGYEARVQVRRSGGGGHGGSEGGLEELAVPSSGSDGEQGEGAEKKFNYVLATLVSNLEKTFTISPASRPLDGQLRLVHFGGAGGERTMEIMTAAYGEGAHVGLAGVGYDAIDEVRVVVDEEDPRWRKVCVDGTIVEVERGGWVSVQGEERARVRVLVDASCL